MDYKEKYEEMLDKLSTFLKDCKKKGHIVARVEDIEEIFPELKENENERIRKMIINTLNRDDALTEDETYDCIAWLKKQGEQEPAKWNEEDENKIDSICYFLDTAKKHYGSTVELDACIEWLKYLRPQKITGYNPYKAVIDSITEMCKRYDKTSHMSLSDFYDNVKVKCKEAAQYDEMYPQKQWKPTEEQMDALRFVYQHFTPAATDKLAWDSLKTIELMCYNLKEL